MKSTTTSDDPKMETRVLMPSELSLVVTRRPLPPLDRLVPLEECIKVCSTIRRIPTSTRYFPYSGTVRADKLPLLPYLPSFDVRTRFGGYDASDDTGRRTCNWVRFLKVSPIYNNDVNILGHRFGPRCEIVFEVVRDIPFGGELIAFLIPEGGTPEESIFLPALHIIRSSIYRRTIDTIMADAPLDLSRSLLTAPKRDGSRGTETPSPSRGQATSDAEELHSHSDESPSPSPTSIASLSPPHSSSGFPSSPTSFLPNNSCSLSFPQQTNNLLMTQDLRFSGVASIISRISPPGLPTPPSSNSGSPPNPLRDSPIHHLSVAPPKRRERTMLPCSECGKAFDRPSLLKRHMRTHTGEKPHVCDVCGKGFSTSSSLNTHRRIHSGEKPHQCGVCGKRFTASSNLYYHKMTHIKEKPHKCALCTRSFPTPGDLRSHMFVHNGQWPHKCTVCSKGFSKLTNLRNHTLLHTAKSRVSPPSPSLDQASDTSI